MANVLVTGFSPFDGRQVNASWIAARSLSTYRTALLPVLWSAPARYLSEICATDCPEVIVSMGEGREGWFDIETVARNTRKERADNEGVMPEGKPVLADGPQLMHASIDARQLQRAIARHHYPIRISTDAGAFLCEETLYTLETLKASYPRLTTVVFVHVPPFGTTFYRNGAEVKCEEAALADFAALLVESVLALSKA